jgi:hypothetical protein
MKKRLVIAILAVILTLLFRFVQVWLSITGEGKGVKSPDMRFNAQAESWYTKRFFGGRHDYYEFSIEAADGHRIQHIVMDVPPEGMIGWREEGAIGWATDSSRVTYAVKGTQLVLSVVP